MKRLQSILLILAAASGLASPVGASDRWETLRAINLVENPTNQTAYGRRGELGPYQFRADTWRMHTRKPFRLANDRATADEVAVNHYEWIRRSLSEAGVDPTTFNIAMAWNCGLTAVASGRIPSESYRYARQVTNLVEAMHGAAAPEPVVRTESTSGFTLEAPQPRFTIAPEAPRLVVAGEEPRYVIGVGEPPRYVLAVN